MGGFEEFITRTKVLLPSLTDAELMAAFLSMRPEAAQKRERADETDMEFVDRQLMVERAKMELRRQEKERQFSDPTMLVYVPTVNYGSEIDVSVVYPPIICTTVASYERLAVFESAVVAMINRVHDVMYQIAPHDSRKRHHEVELQLSTQLGKKIVASYNHEASCGVMLARQDESFLWMKMFLGIVLAIQKASQASLCERIIDTKAAITPMGSDSIRDPGLRARRQGTYWNLVFRQASAEEAFRPCRGRQHHSRYPHH